MSSLTPSEPGSFIGGYELISPIGRGGMAEVWLARRQGTLASRHVAVKLIADHYVGNPSYRRMFRAEAELSGLLTHANIVQVFDEGEEHGRSYLVMEWIDGVDLGKLRPALELANEGHRFRIASYVTGQLLHALSYAHNVTGANGEPLCIVHRDVSPQNVLISNQGEVKLTDFGVAHHMLEESSGLHVKGKLRYMSPEQLGGKTRAPTVDLFAVGAILQELLDGRPFRDGVSDQGEMFGMVIRGELPELQTEAPPELDALRRGLLEPEPDKRIPNADAALEMLGRFPGYRDARRELSMMCRALTGVERPRSGLGETTMHAPSSGLITAGRSRGRGELLSQGTRGDRPSQVKTGPRPRPHEPRMPREGTPGQRARPSAKGPPTPPRPPTPPTTQPGQDPRRRSVSSAPVMPTRGGASLHDRIRAGAGRSPSDLDPSPPVTAPVSPEAAELAARRRTTVPLDAARSVPKQRVTMPMMAPSSAVRAPAAAPPPPPPPGSREQSGVPMPVPPSGSYQQATVPAHAAVSRPISLTAGSYESSSQLADAGIRSTLASHPAENTDRQAALTAESSATMAAAALIAHASEPVTGTGPSLPSQREVTDVNARSGTGTVTSISFPPAQAGAASTNRWALGLGGVALLVSIAGGGATALWLSDRTTAPQDQVSEATATATKDAAPDDAPGSLSKPTVDKLRPASSNAEGSPAPATPDQVASSSEPSGSTTPTQTASSTPPGTVVSSPPTADDGQTMSPDDPPPHGRAPGSEPPRHNTKPCLRARTAAGSANAARNWSQVEKHTRSRSCWAPSGRGERMKLRIKALVELRRFADCVKLGRHSKDPKIREQVRVCRDMVKNND